MGARRHRPHPNDVIEHDREMPHPMERQVRATPQYDGPEIESAINRALFHQQAPAHIRTMNARRHTKGAITGLTRQNATAVMALRYRDIMITAAGTVNKGVVDVEET